jgi:UDP-3-O-[3-hydroxymyristoyl] N-acetylglucosamine deacetylase/3-hydroxyacyl-[acyl-carrier-protein] dehydratase
MDDAPVLNAETVLMIEEIQNLLPHRYPFALVDRIIEYVPGKKAVGLKNVTINEPHFQGHFPGRPIMPGVLIVEAMAQVASVLLLRMPGNEGKIGYFLSANNVKWRKPVLPGDVLMIETEVLKAKRGIGQAVGRCSVNGQVVSEADLMFSIMDR